MIITKSLGYLKKTRFNPIAPRMAQTPGLTLLHSKWPKIYGVLAILSAIGLIQKR